MKHVAMTEDELQAIEECVKRVPQMVALKTNALGPSYYDLVTIEDGARSRGLAIVYDRNLKNFCVNAPDVLKLVSIARASASEIEALNHLIDNLQQNKNWDGRTSNEVTLELEHYREKNTELGDENERLRAEIERLVAKVREQGRATIQVMHQRDEAYDHLETACFNLGCSVEDFLEGLSEDGDNAA
jgi:regulator of replication initiation timing